LSNPKTLFSGANRPASLDHVHSSLAMLVLEYMMQCNDQLLTQALLLEEVWSHKFVPATDLFVPATDLVVVHIGRLRLKVDMPNEVPTIHNVRGAGFILRAAS
jgi:two-component system, OmpR family, response regulator